MKPIVSEHVATLREVFRIFRSTIYPPPLASPVGEAQLDAAIEAVSAAEERSSVDVSLARAVFAAEFVRSLDTDRRRNCDPNRRRAFIAAAEAVAALRGVSTEKFVVDQPTLDAIALVIG